MYIRVELLNIIEPLNDAVRHCIVCGNVEVVSMLCSTAPKSIAQNSVNTMTMERSSLSPTVYWSWISLRLRDQKATGLLSKLPSDSGGISVNVKGFIVIRISKEAILCHECFHAFESKIYLGCPLKSLLS